MIKEAALAQSIIEVQTERLQRKLHDSTLDHRFVALIVQKLSEKDIEELLDYCLRKSNNPGHAFVKLCDNVMKSRNLK